MSVPSTVSMLMCIFSVALRGGTNCVAYNTADIYLRMADLLARYAYFRSFHIEGKVHIYVVDVTV
jgi:hypothetical protein